MAPNGGKTAGGDMVERHRRSGGWRFLRPIAKLAATLVALPLILVPVYAVVPPISTLMLADLVTFRGFSRIWTPLDHISPHLQQAVVMSEDGRYCAHGGVDWDALTMVIEQAVEDGPSRGASTIPMQTVKNLFLWSSRSYVRKALEIPLALYADLVWSKRRTLEIYLNVAEWGPGIYGAEAAARAYFDKSAADLTRREAALLATALPNPAARDPGSPSAGHRRLSGVIERRAAQSGAYVGCLAENPS